MAKFIEFQTIQDNSSYRNDLVNVDTIAHAWGDQKTGFTYIMLTSGELIRLNNNYHALVAKLTKS